MEQKFFVARAYRYKDSGSWEYKNEEESEAE